MGVAPTFEEVGGLPRCCAQAVRACLLITYATSHPCCVFVRSVDTDSLRGKLHCCAALWCGLLLCAVSSSAGRSGAPTACCLYSKRSSV